MQNFVECAGMCARGEKVQGVENKIIECGVVLGTPHFAEKSDYFMRFEVYSRPEPGRSLAGKSRNSNVADL